MGLSHVTAALPAQGGKEAKHSNRVLHDLIVRAVEEEAPEVGRDLIGLVTSREGVAELLVHDDVIDLVIPRGSNALVNVLAMMTSCTVLAFAPVHTLSIAGHKIWLSELDGAVLALSAQRLS